MALVATLLIAGCNQHSADPTLESGPQPPLATADDNTWGLYLASQGKVRVKDMPVTPHIFLIPDGESPDAISRRKELAQYMVSAIGPIILPGSAIIIGGRSPSDTNAFVQGVAGSLPQGALKDTVVLIVTNKIGEDDLPKALEGTQATVRFAKMQQK